MTTRYTPYSEHPLCRIKQEVLDLAREETAVAVNLKMLDPGLADCLADSIVGGLIPFLAPHCWEEPDAG